ncbi:embrane-bound lytic murein transglycosylase D [Candidatus Photodesmus katoptron]|uniref:LysM protein n=1 Tax=Candidatus Photodesmus katoptron Akat1 TaxID=1236703 RepID=S3DHY8_9GAMM|nr:LysM protein [Candidatus Photodesmus katoptron Akat1]KEY90044.1 embrane-bound lytic murein transglycosylase D [Candidatus Photodesmus katoptron]
MRILCNFFLFFLTGCQLTQSPKTFFSLPTDIAEKKAEKKLRINQSQVEIQENSILSTPQSQEDAWKRIAMQLKMEIPNHETIERYRNWYIKNPNHLNTVSKRAEPFLYLIIDKIEQRNMPLELALLPVIESSFDTLAYSQEKASGLWQFLSNTGKSYGLEQNFWYDGRLDVAASTDAALDYLTHLNKRFNGNWKQAIAAYNSGGGRISSAIRKNNRLGKPIDFLSLDLPKETTSYVQKLLALADIISNSEKYGIKIPAVANKPVVKLVNPKIQLDLTVAAKYAGISIQKLQKLNPAYNQYITAPDGPYQLLLPIDSIQSFNDNIKKHQGKGIKVICYQVKAGDSLILLAKKYKTTTKLIQRTNNLSNNKIFINQYLLIPSFSKNQHKYIKHYQ